MFRVPDVGSGSGGGEFHPHYRGNWDDFKHAWSNHLTFGYGHHLDSAVGVHAESRIGAHAGVTLNPLGLVGLLGQKVPASTHVAANLWKQMGFSLLGVLGGHADFTIGAGTHAGYGPSLAIHCGWGLETHSVLAGHHLGVKTVVGVSLAEVALLQGLLAASPFMAGGEVIQYVAEGGLGVFLGVIAQVEKASAIADEALLKVKEGQMDGRTVTELGEHDASPNALRLFANSLMRRAGEIEEYADRISDTAQIGVSVNRATAGPYTQTSHDLTLTSENPAAATTINIEARGQALAAAPVNNGTLNLRASSLLNLHCGYVGGGTPSTIAMNSEPGLHGYGIDVNSRGRIRIAKGRTASSPRLDMDVGEIGLHFGPEIETEGPRIILDHSNSRLTLAVGAAEGPRIVLTTAGIELFGADNTKITLGGAAHNLKLERGTRSLTVNANDVTVS